MDTTTMTFSYTWADADQTTLKRSDGAFIPTDPRNRDYAEFLSSGAAAAPYVEPPPPTEPTLTEKLASIGLSIDDLKEALK